MEKSNDKISFDVDYWVRTDMSNMRTLFGYCADIFKEITSANLDVDKFIHVFLNSRIREAAEDGNPKFLGTFPHKTMEQLIIIDLNKDYSIIELKTGEQNYDEWKLEWVGETYSYVSCRSLFRFSYLEKIMPFERMKLLYLTGHQMNHEQFYNRIKDELFANKKWEFE